jgi:hypothetical protein
MYQPQQPQWLGVGFLVCVGLVAALGALHHFGKAKPPNWLFGLLIGLAFLLVLAIYGQKVDEDKQLRSELKNLDPLSISNITVIAGTVRRRLADPNELKPLFSLLQRVAPASAHHSHPVLPVEVEFMNDSHLYRYRIGQDSERPEEYWVLETARAGEFGREIGRVESPELGRVLQALAAGPSAPRP